MEDIGQAFALAARLIASGDGELMGIVLLSLRVSLTATALAFVLGAPLGAALATAAFPGRQAVVSPSTRCSAFRPSSSGFWSTSRSRAPGRWAASAFCSPRRR